ncbi:hypothetical protein [Chromobacterium phragmitis]|uniref:Uncharacterized protein n=1 Tax=Chromobacterium phragmitis TaxID=2202141 RepID=A0ABV0J272_9NEIS
MNELYRHSGRLKWVFAIGRMIAVVRLAEDPREKLLARRWAFDREGERTTYSLSFQKITRGDDTVRALIAGPLFIGLYWMPGRFGWLKMLKGFVRFLGAIWWPFCLSVLAIEMAKDAIAGDHWWMIWHLLTSMTALAAWAGRSQPDSIYYAGD